MFFFLADDQAEKDVVGKCLSRFLFIWVIVSYLAGEQKAHVWITNQCRGYQLLVTNHPKTQRLKQYFSCLPPPCSSVWAGLRWAVPVFSLVLPMWSGVGGLLSAGARPFLLRAMAPSGLASRVAGRLHGCSELPRVSSSNGRACLRLKPRTSTALSWLKHPRASPDSGRGMAPGHGAERCDPRGAPRVMGCQKQCHMTTAMVRRRSCSWPWEVEAACDCWCKLEVRLTNRGPSRSFHFCWLWAYFLNQHFGKLVPKEGCVEGAGHLNAEPPRPEALAEGGAGSASSPRARGFSPMPPPLWLN